MLSNWVGWLCAIWQNQFYYVSNCEHTTHFTLASWHGTRQFEASHRRLMLYPFSLWKQSQLSQPKHVSKSGIMRQFLAEWSYIQKALCWSFPKMLSTISFLTVQGLWKYSRVGPPEFWMLSWAQLILSPPLEACTDSTLGERTMAHPSQKTTSDPIASHIMSPNKDNPRWHRMIQSMRSIASHCVNRVSCRVKLHSGFEENYLMKSCSS